MRSLQSMLISGLAVLAVATWTTARAAAPPDAAKIAKFGNGKGAPPCMSCHGADGGGNAAAGYPRLAGLNKTYLLKQLDNFASGSRENPVMQPNARALTPAERVALAAYYSAMPIPPAAAKGMPGKVSDQGLGAQLANDGRWSRKIPACVRCHGPHGVGVGTRFPPLAGQPATYLANQLEAWRDGKRHNDPLQLMQHVSSGLSAADIKAVSAWFAAQPASVKGGTP